MIRLSIVIVTWNAKQFTGDCLTSLQPYLDDSAIEIIVVDNASEDGTPELVAERFPRVRLIRNPQNFGFAKANNIGMRASSGEYVCLVNSDVTVPYGCLEAMTAFMEQNPQVGLLGPKMLGPDGAVRRSTMRFPTVWRSVCRALALDAVFGRFHLFSGFLMRDFAHDRTADVDVLNGWFWMARGAAIRQIGGLDERFFIYGEDVDWCRRFHQAGWRVVFFSSASACHYGGASSSSAPLRFHIEMQRADFQYWKKHHTAAGRLGYLITVWLHHLVRILGYAIIYPFRPSARRAAAFKVRLGVASILWLSKTRPTQ